MPEAGFLSLSCTNEIAVRRASPGDLDDLVRLEQESFVSDRLSRRSLAALARSPSALMLVAEHAGKLAGYALVLFRRGSRIARLYSLAVARNVGRRGIGSTLVAAAEAAALEAGATALRLEVRADNGPAIRLYEGRGYRLKERRGGYYEDGMDALAYLRELTPAAASLERAA
jgi:ribosomal protein S18 acetylase RimI-like enzyme